MLLAAGPLLIVAWCEKAEPVLRELLGGDSLGAREVGDGNENRERAQPTHRSREGGSTNNEGRDKKQRDDKGRNGKHAVFFFTLKLQVPWSPVITG